MRRQRRRTQAGHDPHEREIGALHHGLFSEIRYRDADDGPQVLGFDIADVAAAQPESRVTAKQPEHEQDRTQDVGRARSQGRAGYAQFGEGSDAEDQHPVGKDVVHVHDACDPHGRLGVAGRSQDPAAGVDEQAKHAEGEDDGHVLLGPCDDVRLRTQEHHEILAEHQAQRGHHQTDGCSEYDPLTCGLASRLLVAPAQVPRHDGARGHPDAVEHENHGKEDHGTLAHGGESQRSEGSDKDAVDDVYRRVHQVFENGRPCEGEDGAVEALSGEVEHGVSERSEDWKSGQCKTR